MIFWKIYVSVSYSIFLSISITMIWLTVYLIPDTKTFYEKKKNKKRGKSFLVKRSNRDRKFKFYYTDQVAKWTW